MPAMGTPQERNYKLSNLAASDAFHDFDTMGRLSAENKALKENVLREIWIDTKEMGTLDVPVDYKHEDDAFEDALGIPIHDIKKPGPKRPLTVLNAGKDSIEYEWRTVQVATKSGADYVYEDSLELFEEIAGPGESTLYFMIDAINVNFYAALTNDRGAKTKEVVYLSTRERTNDSAGNRDLTGYVQRSKDSKVQLKILRDELPTRVNYTPLERTSTNPLALFNSVYTLSLENKPPTKEGLDTSILIFKDANASTLKTVVSQSGSATHESTVNSLYGKLVAFFKKRTAKDEYFITLQQKRSGDWLQVLSTFQRNRYGGKVPAGAPVFLASEDRLCVLYGLLVGANMIYTHQQGDKNYITIFRRKQKLTAAERRKEQLAALQERLTILLAGSTSLEKGPVVPGGISFEEAAAIYLKFVTDILGKLGAEVTAARAATTNRLAGLVQQRFSPTAYDSLMKPLFSPLYTILLFFRAFQVNLYAISDVKLTLEDVKTNMERASAKIEAWESAANVFRDLFKENVSALHSAEAFQKGLVALYGVFEASNKERDAVLNEMTLSKPLYEQAALGFLQQLSMMCPDSFLTPLKPFFTAIHGVAETVLSGQPSSDTKKKAQVVRMNAAILDYLLLHDTQFFPAEAVPSFAELLNKTFEKPAATRKGNLFAVHRLLSSAYQRFVASKEREQRIAAFLKAFSAQSGGARTARLAHRPIFGRSQTAKLVRRIERLTAKVQRPLTASITRASTSLERSYVRQGASDTSVVSSLLPLYMVDRMLEEFSYYPDIHPYEVVPMLRGLLARMLNDSVVLAANRTFAPHVDSAIFRGAYYEWVGYFLFNALPNATKNPVVLSLFSGKVYLPHLEEVGRLLVSGVLGQRPGLSYALDAGFAAECEKRLTGLFVFLGEQSAVATTDLRKSIVAGIRTMEGFRHKSVVSPGTPTRSKSKSRPGARTKTVKRNMI